MHGALLLLIAAWALYADDGSSATSVAQRFFPPRLSSAADLRARGLKPGRMETAASTAKFGKGKDEENGSKFIVAVYSNGWEGAVRVLQRRDDVWQVVNDVTITAKVSHPSVLLRELDGDGTPEVIVGYRLHSPTDDGSWIFRWTGTRLQDISPEGVAAQADVTAWSGTSIVDYVPGPSGTTDLISQREEQVATGEGSDDEPRRQTVYSLARIDHGSYRFVKDLVAYAVFWPHRKRAVSADTTTFTADDPGAHYFLRVFRAGAQGDHRVRSAEIRLNGALIAGPNEFRSQAVSFTIPVGLLPKNSLAVKILEADAEQGDDGDERRFARLVVLVEPK